MIVSFTDIEIKKLQKSVGVNEDQLDKFRGKIKNSFCYKNFKIDIDEHLIVVMKAFDKYGSKDMEESLERLKHYIRPLNIADQIEFCGHIVGKDYSESMLAMIYTEYPKFL